MLSMYNVYTLKLKTGDSVNEISGNYQNFAFPTLHTRNGIQTNAVGKWRLRFFWLSLFLKSD